MPDGELSFRSGAAPPPDSGGTGRAPFERMAVVGVPVTVATRDGAAQQIVEWAAAGRYASIFFRDVHGIMRCRGDRELQRVHERADLVLPDGVPLVWVGRLRGHDASAMTRVSGYDMVDEICRRTAPLGLRHYFFGGKPGVAEAMAATLSARNPGLAVAGTFSPPMRDVAAGEPLSADELREIEAIKASGAQLVWIGLSTPKQELWIARARAHFDTGVFLGVGAAFDNYAGAVSLAPQWMRSNGLEWLYRLAVEPRRLWRRYLVMAPQFIALEIKDELARLLAKRSRAQGEAKPESPGGRRDR